MLIIRKSSVSSVNQRGFTLIELMITLFIIAITAAIAVPSYKTFIDNNKVKNAAMQLQSGLMYARSEAIKRNEAIYLVPSGGSSTGWANGWSITTSVKSHADCKADAEDCLKIIPAASGVKVVNAAPTEITYNKQGRTTSATFELCDEDNEATKRTITISSTGASKVTQGGGCP